MGGKVLTILSWHLPAQRQGFESGCNSHKSRAGKAQPREPFSRPRLRRHLVTARNMIAGNRRVISVITELSMIQLSRK